MGTYGNDYYDNLKMLEKYAESSYVGNQVFMGVKGVGKSYLFENYFTGAKIRELADKYKNIFIITALNNRTKDSDLYTFIFEKILSGMISAVSPDELNELKQKLEVIQMFFNTPESKLEHFLSSIKELGYKLVLIMDHFHTMARDSEIGLEQYELLRSLDEKDLITYWLITDTDLKETGVSEDFTASFFAQKFTMKDTICPCCEKADGAGNGTESGIGAEEKLSVMDTFLRTKKYELGAEEKTLIGELSGGVPALTAMLMDGIRGLKGNGPEVTREEIISGAVTNKSWGATSLFGNWTDGLSARQKEIIYTIAQSEDGVLEAEIRDRFNGSLEPYELSELADEVGRGLLHEKAEGAASQWSIFNELFRQFVVSQGERFYLGDAEIVPVEGAGPFGAAGAFGASAQAAGAGRILQDNPAFIPAGNPAFDPGLGVDPGMVSGIPNGVQNVTINYNVNNVTGDYIQNTTTTVLNIDKAVEGLEDLYKLVNRNPALPDNRLMETGVAFLPSRNEAWLEMAEEEKEEALEDFATGIFETPTFGGLELTDEQKRNFNLTDDLLGDLKEGCRKQLICGIQIHDMLQYCMDSFGLDIGADESPRGILFAKSFEQELKDFVRPAFLARTELKEFNVQGKKFEELNQDRTTIGNYSYIMRNKLSLFSNTTVRNLGAADKDMAWWRDFTSRLDNICMLRNGICHSGPPVFDINKLIRFKEGIFNQNTMNDVTYFQEIENSFKGMNASGGNVSSGGAGGAGGAVRYPVGYGVGTVVRFRIDARYKGGRFLGKVDGSIEALLKKASADTLDFDSVQGTEITATVENFQGGRLVLRL